MKSRQQRQRLGSNRRGQLAAAVCTVLVGLSGAAQSAAYDFESLVLNRVLRDQDGWLSVPSLGEIVVRQDDTMTNGSQVAEPLAGLASGWTAYLTRGNDASFGYGPFFGTETEVVIQFDTNAEAATGFALGRDVDGDGLLAWETGEVGPSFGTLRDEHRGTEQFVVTGAAQQGVYLAELNAGGRCCNEDSDWYRLQLRIDLTANGGAGKGSLYYMNLTRGDTQFQAVEELQDLDLALGALHPYAGPASWNAMWLSMQFDGSQNMPRADNLVPRTPAVLEADMTLSLQGVDGRAVFGASYNVELTPVYVTSDPYGHYWRVNQASLAAPGTASGAILLANLNLILVGADVQAVFPELGSIDYVCLRYQGLRGEDPRMTWKYDPLGCY